MFGKTAAVLAVAASCVIAGVPPSLASSTSTPGQHPQAGWYDTNANAALSRANPAEKVLTPSAVTKVKYLRSVVAPLAKPLALCGQAGVAAPLPFGGSLYATTNGSVSKYNPATGKLIWRRTLNQGYLYVSLAISGDLLIVGGSGCGSASEPPGIVYALNAVTGARVWTSAPFGQGPLYEAVVAGSYVITPGSDAAGAEVSVLNLSNGKVVWHNYGCSDEGANPPAGLVVGLRVMSYGCDRKGNQTIQASNVATGKLVWSLPGRWTLQRGDLSGSSGKHLYATNPAGTVVDLNPQTGQAGYSLSQAVKVLAVDASRVYATCGSHGKHVCAYNISTGALEWKNTRLLTPGNFAAEADGVLYLEFGDALNAATGQKITILWSYNFRGVSAIAVGDGRIAVVSTIDARVLDLFGLPGH